MSKPLVIVQEDLDRLAYGPEGIVGLRERFALAEFMYFNDRAEMDARIEEAEVIAGAMTPTWMTRAKNLRWVHTWANGADPLLFPEMVNSDVVLTCSRGNGGIPLAEHGMMLMLMLNRGVMRSIRAQAEHRWERYVHPELNGLTCGIVGLGTSGVDLAEKAKAFHMRVLGVRRRDVPTPFVDEIFSHDNLDEFVAASDFLVITAPITPETRGMFGEAHLKLMKPTAYVICFSRGGIIDDGALLRALTEGWIAGAGLDAHGVEPLPADSPFWDAPNTIITPHIGAVSIGMSKRGAETFEANLERYLAGQPLRESDLVDKVAGY